MNSAQRALKRDRCIEDRITRIREGNTRQELIQMHLDLEESHGSANVGEHRRKQLEKCTTENLALYLHDYIIANSKKAYMTIGGQVLPPR